MALPSTELPTPPPSGRHRPPELVEALPTSVYLVAADDGRLLALNPAAQARAAVPLRPGLPLDELLRALHLHLPDGRPCCARDLPLAAARHGGRGRIHLLAPAGGRWSLSPVLLTLLPLPRATPAVETLGVLVEELPPPPADPAFGDLMAVLAHELRAPLTALRGGARALRRHWSEIDESTRDELLRDLDGESERLHELVDDVVDFLRAQAGHLRLRRQPTLLPPLAAAVSEAAYQRTGIHVRLDLPHDLPPLDADPVRLARMLRLLLEAATRVGSGNDGLALRARSHGAWCELSLAGPRLEPSLALIARLAGLQATWQPDGESGLVLLLCIARTLVEAHGGDLRITTSGNTAAFEVRLPCVGAV